MNRLYALHVKSTDARASADWYVKHLGARIIDIRNKPDGELTVYADLVGLPVNFTQHPDADRLPRAPESVHIGLEHFGLIVDDLAKVLDQMRASGVDVLVPQTSGPDSRWAFVRGPDGIRQELVELLRAP